MGSPLLESLLNVLTEQRLIDLSREVGFSLSLNKTRAAHVELILTRRLVSDRRLLSFMSRNELKIACRNLGLSDSGRDRDELISRLMGDSPRTPSAYPSARSSDSGLPVSGDIVQVRHRQYLVEEVLADQTKGHCSLVKLVCLDDDAQGRSLMVPWELELGARILRPESHGLGTVSHIDEPRQFAAYLHALKWSAVTATDSQLFQAPFRAGIKLMNHQLTPLKKALSLPRANLFIADDVGLGKTIEAGLVAQELLLRQRVDYLLIVCPAAVALQWQGEMEKRFGLRFEIYNRDFMARRRQERGFQVNPWTTHSRFIISYQTIRRPEYRDPLLQHLGERAPKSLLILDEAHTAAPATASRYAIDSRVTRVIRDIAPRFENRLFLSATPHNGHSNSFSALLEILDPQRFTRGVPIKGPEQLQPVMVRRLKSDLRALSDERMFPDRDVVQIELTHDSKGWTKVARHSNRVEPAQALGESEPVELRLAKMLAEYTELAAPPKGPGRLVFINLQKRLLSSIEAFYRTLSVHSAHLQKTQGALGASLELPVALDPEAEEYGLSDEALDEAEQGRVAKSSRSLTALSPRAQQLLSEMLSLSAQYRLAPDAKVLALLSWIQEQQCQGVRLGDDSKLSAQKRKWSDRRVIIFTEYGDTKRYLLQLLQAAVEPTDRGAERIMQFHGGMSDESRAAVQKAFNGPPESEPVRILIATDAAREGVNLQGHCADLFHFDVPWNPARMEQRNGRIDRTLQPSPEVRCMYFFYPQRVEDQVLRTVVNKVGLIQDELGSLGAVVMDRYAEVLEGGIDHKTRERLDAAEQVDQFKQVTKRELEAQRDNKKALRDELDQTGKILNASRNLLNFDPALLRDALDMGCELAGAARLSPVQVTDEKTTYEAFELPELSESWQQTLDSLRPSRAKDQPFWEWRKLKPLPVVFSPPEKMTSAVEHLHLQHPFVQRILSRFLAQGYSAQDLSRVTVVPNPNDSLVRVIVFGRLSLFGKGAVRLHDELISVAAQWLESKGPAHLRPFAEEADRKALAQLEAILANAKNLAPVAPTTRERLRQGSAEDFAALWPSIQDEAEERERLAKKMLFDRGQTEAEQLLQILKTQQASIVEKLRGEQLSFDYAHQNEQVQAEQYKEDRKYMERRLVAIDQEIKREPELIKDYYQVVLKRLEPVGMVYLWPTTR